MERNVDIKNSFKFVIFILHMFKNQNVNIKMIYTTKILGLLYVYGYNNTRYISFDCIVTWWFSTLLEILNPTSSIHAFIEPFEVGKKNICREFYFFNLYCSKSLASEPLKLTHRTQVKNHWYILYSQKEVMSHAYIL